MQEDNIYNLAIYNKLAQYRRKAVEDTLQSILLSDGSGGELAEQYFKDNYRHHLLHSLQQEHSYTLTNRDLTNKDLAALADADALALRTPLFVEKDQTIQFMVAKAQYQTGLPSVERKYSAIMWTTIIFGYGVFVAAPVAAIYHLAPIAMAGQRLLEKLEAQVTEGLKNGTLTRLDQRMLELTIREAHIAHSNAWLPMIAVVGVCLLGMVSFWLIKHPIQNQRTKEKDGLLSETVTVLSRTALDAVKQNMFVDKGVPLYKDKNNLATVEVDSKNLLNVLLSLVTNRQQAGFCRTVNGNAPKKPDKQKKDDSETILLEEVDSDS
ncbi:MAG: hypothetical protein JSS50_00760 [Proteobacteria bacterium]|nr:hypothetical protein [Pseudomonadota bacterium]